MNFVALLLVCNFAVVSTATNREHKMHKRFYSRPACLPLFCEQKVVLSLFVTCRNQRLMEYWPLAFVHLLPLETEARCRRGGGGGITRNKDRARAELRTNMDIPSSSAGCPPSPAAARLRGRAVNGRGRIDPGSEQSRPG